MDSDEFEDVLDDKKINCLIRIERDKKIDWILNLEGLFLKKNRKMNSVCECIQILLHI